MSKLFIVVALSLGGLGNKVFKSGDEVKESDFPPGNAEKLVVSGFLKPKVEKKEAVPLIEQFTAKELKDLLTSNEIDFGKNDSKADLFATLIGSLDGTIATTKEELIQALSK